MNPCPEFQHTCRGHQPLNVKKTKEGYERLRDRQIELGRRGIPVDVRLVKDLLRKFPTEHTENFEDYAITAQRAAFIIRGDQANAFAPVGVQNKTYAEKVSPPAKKQCVEQSKAAPQSKVNERPNQPKKAIENTRAKAIEKQILSKPVEPSNVELLSLMEIDTTVLQKPIFPLVIPQIATSGVTTEMMAAFSAVMQATMKTFIESTIKATPTTTEPQPSTSTAAPNNAQPMHIVIDEESLFGPMTPKKTTRRKRSKVNKENKPRGTTAQGPLTKDTTVKSNGRRSTPRPVDHARDMIDITPRNEEELLAYTAAERQRLADEAKEEALNVNAREGVFGPGERGISQVQRDDSSMDQS